MAARLQSFTGSLAGLSFLEAAASNQMVRSWMPAEAFLAMDSRRNSHVAGAGSRCNPPDVACGTPMSCRFTLEYTLPVAKAGF